MSDRFDDPFEDVDAAGERERLRRVHDLLLTVEPPPGHVPQLRFRERRRYPLALLAAALAAAAFGGGYVVGDRERASETVRTIEMSGVGEARGAFATIVLLPADKAGNLPMKMRVRGLAPIDERFDFYELWLTKDGKPLGSCGRFKVHAGVTEVSLSVPYGLRGYDGWVVTRRDSDRVLLTT